MHEPARDLLPLGQRQGQSRTLPQWRPDAARRTNVSKDRGRSLAEHPTDRLEPFALTPAVPELGTLGCCKEPSLRSYSHDTPPPPAKVKCCADRLRSSPEADLSDPIGKPACSGVPIDMRRVNLAIKLDGDRGNFRTPRAHQDLGRGA
jgi:hypothetical protein